MNKKEECRPVSRRLTALCCGEAATSAIPDSGILPHTTERSSVFVLFFNHLVQADPGRS
jgi:hypothetical protein